jgi:hypothetical protein
VRCEPPPPVVAVAAFASQWWSCKRGFHKYADSFAVEELAEGTEYMAMEAGLLAALPHARRSLQHGWAGTVPLHHRGLHLDPWGLNAPEIARKPLTPRRSSITSGMRIGATWSRTASCSAISSITTCSRDRSTRDCRAPSCRGWTRCSGVQRALAGRSLLACSRAPSVGRGAAWLATRGWRQAKVTPLPAGWPPLGAARY